MKYLGFSLSKLSDPQNGNFIKGVTTIHQKSGTAKQDSQHIAIITQPALVFFGCESSPISHNVRSWVSPLVHPSSNAKKSLVKGPVRPSKAQ